MAKVKSNWKAYYPDDGECAEDAITLMEWDFLPIKYADSAAKAAAEYDYNNRDGWERGLENKFRVIVISPAGEEAHFTAYHEAAIDHVVNEAPTPNKETNPNG